MRYLCLHKEKWDKALENLLISWSVFATKENESGIDYELITPEDIPAISYNKPKPITSLKSFFLPPRENVTSEKEHIRKRIILGMPNCDIQALHLLDEIYSDSEFPDPVYKRRRESSVLISADCLTINSSCHCLSYNIDPYSSGTADISVVLNGEMMVLRIISEKGESLIDEMNTDAETASSELLGTINEKQKTIISLLTETSPALPGYDTTSRLVSTADESVWKKYSSSCVSCGACIAVCPTCSCFLLIDKSGFQKLKQMDGCQYPGFERVAGGEDPLAELHKRFQHRYMCKYVWKRIKFSSIACTGCGRCIDACIGKISKNEIFIELEKQLTNV